MHLDPGHGDERGRGSPPARGHGKVMPDCRRTARRWVSHTGQMEPVKAAEAKTLIDHHRRTHRTFASVRRIAPQRQGAGKLSVALQAASVAAVRDRVIASDPSDGIALPRVRRPEAAMTLPTTAQDAWGAFIVVSAFAGLRLGEAAALQVGDIDFLRRTLTVARQVHRAAGGQVEIRAPKYGSERTVYLADGLVEILSAHVAA